MIVVNSNRIFNIKLSLHFFVLMFSLLIGGWAHFIYILFRIGISISLHLLHPYILSQFKLGLLLQQKGHNPPKIKAGGQMQLLGAHRCLPRQAAQEGREGPEETPWDTPSSQALPPAPLLRTA